MKNSATDICSVIETRMNEIMDKIREADSIFEVDPLDSELENFPLRYDLQTFLWILLIFHH